MTILFWWCTTRKIGKSWIYLYLLGLNQGKLGLDLCFRPIEGKLGLNQNWGKLFMYLNQEKNDLSLLHFTEAGRNLAPVFFFLNRRTDHLLLYCRLCNITESRLWLHHSQVILGLDLLFYRYWSFIVSGLDRANTVQKFVLFPEFCRQLGMYVYLY